MSQTNEFTCPTGLKQVNVCGTIGISGSDQIDWSFEEQWTGRHWVDGKKVYQKTVSCGPLPGSGIASKYVPLGVDDIETVVLAWGIAIDDNYISMLPKGYPATANCIDLVYAFSTKSMRIVTAAATAYNQSGLVYITAQYTCTDR